MSTRGVLNSYFYCKNDKWWVSDVKKTVTSAVFQERLLFAYVAIRRIAPDTSAEQSVCRFHNDASGHFAHINIHTDCRLTSPSELMALRNREFEIPPRLSVSGILFLLSTMVSAQKYCSAGTCPATAFAVSSEILNRSSLNFLELCDSKVILILKLASLWAGSSHVTPWGELFFCWAVILRAEKNVCYPGTVLPASGLCRPQRWTFFSAYGITRRTAKYSLRWPCTRNHRRMFKNAVNSDIAFLAGLLPDDSLPLATFCLPPS